MSDGPFVFRCIPGAYTQSALWHPIVHHEGFRAGAHPVAHTVREWARRKVNERIHRKREWRERA